jgi:predicted DNA-binding transcriptional regulator YafY
VAWRLGAGPDGSDARDDGWVEVVVGGPDLDRVLPRILALGARAEVLAPEEARRAARDRLAALLEDGS